MSITTQQQARLNERWNSLVYRLGSSGNESNIFAAVIGGYDNPGRYYHSCRHLLQVLEEFDQVKEQVENGGAVELALWLHDLVYEPGSGVNELISAAAARTYALRLTGSNTFADKVDELIRATTHACEPKDRDTAFMLDIDLAILGYPRDRFEAYEDGIRKEFSFLPLLTYRKERRTVLTGFLKRHTLYHTAYFQERYEKPARDNVRRLLEKWEQGT